MVDAWLAQSTIDGSVLGAFGSKAAARNHLSGVDEESYRLRPLNIVEPRIDGSAAVAEPQIVERVVEKIVEVPVEVEVEKIVERVVEIPAATVTASVQNVVLGNQLKEALINIEMALEQAKAPQSILDFVHNIVEPALSSYEEEVASASSDPALQSAPAAEPDVDDVDSDVPSPMPARPVTEVAYEAVVGAESDPILAPVGDLDSWILGVSEVATNNENETTHHSDTESQPLASASADSVVI